MGFATASLAWAIAFALPNLYWATGGGFGQETIAADPEAALGWGAEAWALLLTGAIKVAAGVIAYAAERRRSRVLVYLTLLLGAGFLLYGLANLGQHALVLGGVFDAPTTVGEYAVRWHLLLWDPVWLFGGVLFLATGWRVRPRSR